MGSTPLASGSRVPPWPTLVFGSPASRRMRFTALTAVVDPRPTGLSSMIHPWSMPPCTPAETGVQSARLFDALGEPAPESVGDERLKLRFCDAGDAVLFAAEGVLLLPEHVLLLAQLILTASELILLPAELDLLARSRIGLPSAEPRLL